MKNLNNLDKNEILELIENGLNILIKGFENIGFRRKTNERLKVLEQQVALLSKKAIEDVR